MKEPWEEERKRLLDEQERLKREVAHLRTALETSEKSHQDLQDILPDAVYQYDLSGKIVDCNVAAEDLFVPPGGDRYSIQVKNTISKEDHPQSAQAITRLMRGESVVAERTFIRHDGSRFAGELHAAPVWQGDQVVGVRGVIRDINKRKRAEQALRESEARFRAFFDLCPLPVVVTREDTGELINVNQKFCELTGHEREEALGRGSLELGLYPQKDRNRLLEGLQKKKVVAGMEMTFKARSGQTINALLFAQRILVGDTPHILAICLDTTRKKKMEAELRHARKMEALGTLTGGLAHDFNNLLMTIRGNVSLLLEDPAFVHEHELELMAVEHAVASSSRLIRQLMGFAREGRIKTVPTNLTDLVGTTVDIFARSHPGVLVRQNHTDRPAVCEVDRVKFEGMLLNLLMNAHQAMPEGGTINVSVSHRELDQETTGPQELPPGPYVCLKVQDTGVGMTPAVRERIFEPFFTTKREKKGTGLGLASAYGTVKAHGGAITAESAPRQGTTFEVLLPETRDRPPAPLKTPALTQARGETVLLVDDEALVLRVGSQMLQRLGYKVLEAREGSEALSLLESRKEEVRLAIVDLMMPGMDGVETREALRQIAPKLPVILSTGMVPEKAGTNQDLWDGALAKPFNLRELAQTVHRVLHPQGPRPEGQEPPRNL